MIALYGHGYIGSAFALELARRNLHFIHLRHDGSYPRSGVELVINCAAFITTPSVDLCERHKEACLDGNLVFPAQLATRCALDDIPLIHVSTGCLYNGDNEGRGWSEKDLPQLTFDQGAGFYVGSKALAEQAVRHHEKAYICRIRLPFDNLDNPRNYLTKLLTYDKLLLADNSISHRGDFVKACLDLWQLRAPYGIYNITNPGFINTHSLCLEMIIFGLMKKIKPYWSVEAFQAIAPTLKSNCIHDVSKLLATGVRLRPVHMAITESLQTWKKA